MSFGFAEVNRAIRNAISTSVTDRQGSVVFFAAAANNGSNQQEMFPASDVNVISVRGTDYNGIFIGAYNPPPHPRKEGQPVYGTLGQNVPYTAEKMASGCSIATPIMVGMVAMVMQWMHYSTAPASSPSSKSNSHDDKVIQSLHTFDGVSEILKQESVGLGGLRQHYFHIWNLFRDDGEACASIIRGYMLKRLVSY